MRRIRIGLLFFISLFFFCKNPKAKEVLPKEASVPTASPSVDSLSKQQTVVQTKTDTAQWISFFVNQLIQNKDKKHFVLKKVLIDDYTQDILFYQGNVFSEHRNQALVFLTAKNAAHFFLLDWEKGTWQLKQIIPVMQWMSYEHKGTNALQIEDLNGDQIKDLAVHFYFMSGKYNCNSCYETYLYDPQLKKYVKNSILENYLDVYFVPHEKKVYYGNHGYGVEFYQGIWVGTQIKPVEKYTFKTAWGKLLNDYYDDKSAIDSQNPVTRFHYQIQKSKEILVDSAKNAPLPVEWAKIFKLQNPK